MNDIDELKRKIRLNDIDAIKKIIATDPEGSYYKKVYSTEGKKVDYSPCYPVGNNVLLDAIATDSYEVANLFIDDAQKKIKEQDFLDFINYQYPLALLH